MLVPWGMDNLFLQVIELMLLIMMGMDIADLFNSVPDAVASIANYLKIHGWKRDGSVVQGS